MNMPKKRYSHGMQSPQARNAMLLLIAVFLSILVVTIAKPTIINSFDDLIPIVKSHPVLFYILDSFCILLALYIGFLKKKK